MAKQIKKEENKERLLQTVRTLPVNIFIVITGLFLIPQIEFTQYWYEVFYALIIMISSVNGIMDLYEIWWLN